ncbi:hypothetical protein MASR2M78_22040 [Treponema sp.]
MKKTMCISDAALFIVILLGVANTIACTNTILDAMSDETKSAYKPVSTPASSSLITVHESLRLVFPRSMKGVKLTLGGTLGSFGTEALTWTQTNASQDTLLLNASCVPQWNAGDSRTLTINIKADGESADYSFTFDVIKAVCVADPNIAPSEADNGTMAHPLRSIQAGIDYASEHFISAGFGPVDVRVGGGLFS